jgi:hypothetical protein
LTTKLESTLKRELIIKGQPYRLTISPAGLHLAPKGRRKGYELAWTDLVSGDAALATALNASLSLGSGPDPAASPHSRSTASAPDRTKPARRASSKS